MEIKKAVEPVAEPVVEPKADNEAEAKSFIYRKESGNRTDAINPSSGACGLGQALPCSKLPCTLQDYECQDKWFTDYAIRRYGSWSGAKAHWLAKVPINGQNVGHWW